MSYRRNRKSLNRIRRTDTSYSKQKGYSDSRNKRVTLVVSKYPNLILTDFRIEVVNTRHAGTSSVKGSDTESEEETSHISIMDRKSQQPF